MPSFESMGLKEDLLRGIYAYGNSINDILFFPFNIRINLIPLENS